MTIEGRIAIDATFNDMDSSGVAQASKTISLTSSTPYTTGKVAVVSGTIGTAQQVFLNLYSTQYRDASGNLVTFASTAISRIAFAFQGAAGQSRKFSDSNGNVELISRDNEVACSSVTASLDGLIDTAANTGTYTVVIYGT
jgi:hypothetical protein